MDEIGGRMSKRPKSLRASPLLSLSLSSHKSCVRFPVCITERNHFELKKWSIFSKSERTMGKELLRAQPGTIISVQLTMH